jgi:hypothetical protein
VPFHLVRPNRSDGLVPHLEGICPFMEPPNSVPRSNRTQEWVLGMEWFHSIPPHPRTENTLSSATMHPKSTKCSSRHTRKLNRLIIWMRTGINDVKCNRHSKRIRIFNASDRLCEWNARKDHMRFFFIKRTPTGGGTSGQATRGTCRLGQRRQGGAAIPKSGMLPGRWRRQRASEEVGHAAWDVAGRVTWRMPPPPKPAPCSRHRIPTLTALIPMRRWFPRWLGCFLGGKAAEIAVMIVYMWYAICAVFICLFDALIHCFVQ